MDIRELFHKVGFISEVSLNLVMVLGDFPVELEVLLLQWGSLVLGCPLGWGEDYWHHVGGLGLGLGLVLAHQWSVSVIYICKQLGVCSAQ